MTIQNHQGGRPNHEAMKANSKDKLLVAKQRARENDRRRNGKKSPVCQDIALQPAPSVNKGAQPSKPKGDGSKASAEPLCIHHWKIEENVSPTSQGTCCKCGAVKKFPNTMYIDSMPLQSFGRLPLARHQHIVLEGSRPHEY